MKKFFGALVLSMLLTILTSAIHASPLLYGTNGTHLISIDARGSGDFAKITGQFWEDPDDSIEALGSNSNGLFGFTDVNEDFYKINKKTGEAGLPLDISLHPTIDEDFISGLAGHGTTLYSMSNDEDIDSPNELFSINTDTNTVTFIGELDTFGPRDILPEDRDPQYYNLKSLAMAPDGSSLWGVWDEPVFGSTSLVNIDPTTAALSIIGDGTLPGDINAIATDFLGELYGVNILTGDLINIDTSSGSWSLIGNDSDLIGVSGLASNTSSPVPEPGTMLLLGSGLFGLGAFRKKFKK